MAVVVASDAEFCGLSAACPDRSKIGKTFFFGDRRHAARGGSQFYNGQSVAWQRMGLAPISGLQGPSPPEDYSLK